MEFWSGLLGAIIGGAVALGGAWLQGRHARNQADARRIDEQRRDWFDDLRRVYKQIGRHYSGVAAAFGRYVMTRQEAVRVPDWAENLHAQMLLHMHGASDEVLAASDAFMAIDRDMLDRPTGQATWDDYHRMVDALGTFYAACGTHFDEVWPTGDEDG